MSDDKFLPYAKHHITDRDIEAVVDVLKSDWLTQGPVVPDFESALADYVGADEAVACSHGTAALHLAMMALGLEEGDAVVVPSNTFLATANCARFVGAKVIFADIDPETGLISPESVAQLLRQDKRRDIKAILPVHFGGQPADLPLLYEMAHGHGARIVDDACHAFGAAYKHEGQKYRMGGNPHSDMTVFSFHPIKHIAMGEGGAVVTDDPELAESLRLFRCHGVRRNNFINSDMAFDAEGVPNSWYYEMDTPGYNFRLTDIQAALGLSQLQRQKELTEARRSIADTYRKLIARTFNENEVVPHAVRENVDHAYHLFTVRIDFENSRLSRAVVMNRLRAAGVGTQVHYIPVHLQPYYRRVSPADPWSMQGTEAYYASTLSLPMYPRLTEKDIERVVEQLAEALEISSVKTAARTSVKQDNPV